MIWDKKPLPSAPSPALGTTPPLKPFADNQTQVKDAMVKLNEQPVTTNANHSYVGSSCVLKGDLSGDEDLLIEGQFDGSINLRERCLTIGTHSQVKAEIQAARVVISGAVTGNITARERIDIRKTGRVLGDLVGPSISIEDGAYFKGSIEILREDNKQPAGGVFPAVVHSESSV